MIEKHSDILAFDPVHGQNVFVLPTGLEKTAAIDKTAAIVKQAQVSDQIKEAIDKVAHEDGHAYLLVNAMGAYEYWGANRNHDAFPESGLKFGGQDYGHQTFLSGHNFTHHDNKDPAKAVGSVKFAHYNQDMHRVELLLDTDLKKLSERSPELYEKVASGKPVDVSMGSKCDFDLCTKCGNKAANRTEYCDCLRKHGGEMMGDGQRIVAYTPHPKFFDISYVDKGADVTAKALMYLDKSASHGVPAKVAGHPPTMISPAACPDPSLHKAASANEADYDTPSFPDDHQFSVVILEATEPTIHPDTLAKMAEVGFNESLSTATHLGIVLKPEEYQRVAMIALGHKEAADKMWNAGAVIEPADQGSWFNPSIKEIRNQISTDNFSTKVASLLADHVSDRSAFEPYFTKRAEKAALLPKDYVATKMASHGLDKTAGNFMTPELGAALALGYLVYRKTIPAFNIESIRKAVNDPAVAKSVLGVVVPLIAAGSVVDKMLDVEPVTGSRKMAGIGTGVIAPVAATYLYSAYARRKAERGRPVSGIEHMFVDYPLPIAIGGVLAGQALKRRFKGTIPKVSGIISNVMNKEASLSKELLLALGSGIYRPRPSGALGFLTDVGITTGIVAGAKGVASAVSSGKKKD